MVDKIYSKSGNIGAYEFFKVPVTPVIAINSLKQPLVFFYAFSDSYLYNIPLINALDIEHWQNIREYQQSVFIYENCFEPTDYVTLAKTFDELVSLYKINPNKFYLIVADDVQEHLLKNELEKYNLTDMQVDHLSRCILETCVPEVTEQHSDIKFSLMSRRFVKDRLLLICELINKKLINDFSYSFHNNNPYTNQVIKVSLTDLPLEYQTREIQEWIDQMPYYVNNIPDDWLDQFSNKIYNTILQSKIHIVIETIYHETIYNYDIKNLVPWITEKTYKAIACKKVFLCYSMPRTLETLRQMGFKTFDGVIDESYDLMEDPGKRRKSLVKEINRISLTDLTVINELVKDITEHNFKVLLDKKNKKWKECFLKLGVFK
jgi:hypothetical protein